MRSAAVGLLLALCAACAGEAEPRAVPPEPSPTTPTVPTDPRELAGQWRVEAATAEPGTEVLFVDNGSIDTGVAVYLPCGRMTGAWEADAEQQLFVGQVTGGPSGCFDRARGPVRVPWLDAAARFESDGADMVLLDREGGAVARLQRRGSEGSHLTPGGSSAVHHVAALPSGTRPAVRDDLLRRWLPADGAGRSSRDGPYLEFRADGRWRGSDGCNGQGGRFVLGEEGRLVSVQGPSTLVGCIGAPVGSWMYHSARASISGAGELTLYDADGELVARLVPGEVAELLDPEAD